MTKREDYNGYMSKYICDRYILLKLKAIEYKGGKCSNCGYNKCYGALDFHHRNPDEKEFSWRLMRRKKWEDIVTELDKCDLLCANCHREEHHDPKLLERAKNNDRIRKLKSREKPTEIINCEICDKEIKRQHKGHKFCSLECQIKSQVRIQWPENLPEMVRQSSKLAVARSLGVSDKAVAKRLKNHHNHEKDSS